MSARRRQRRQPLRLGMSTIFVFGDYRLDPARRELTREGALQAVEPQVLDLIIDLIEHRERMVTRAELIERIWQGRIVAEATLSSRIKSARRAIGDSGREQALIRTIHGHGFRFVGAVSVFDDGGDAAAAPEPAPPHQGAAGTPGAEVRLSPPHAGRGDAVLAERRQLTIVRCSLADAALALSALDAEEIDEFLARAKAILVATFEARGATSRRLIRQAFWSTSAGRVPWKTRRAWQCGRRSPSVRHSAT